MALQVSRQNQPHEVTQARLDTLRLAQQQRIDHETPAERQARLEAIKLAQQQRRRNETPCRGEAGSIGYPQTGPTTEKTDAEERQD